MLRLHDGRVLLTFTQRCNGLGRMTSSGFGVNGSNACHGGNLTDGYGTGLRGLLSYDDGASWDFESDYLVISAQDDEHNKVMDGDHIPDPTAPGGPKALWAMGCSCGYGSTVQLSDGSLVTPYAVTPRLCRKRSLSRSCLVGQVLLDKCQSDLLSRADGAWGESSKQLIYLLNR